MKILVFVIVVLSLVGCEDPVAVAEKAVSGTKITMAGESGLNKASRPQTIYIRVEETSPGSSKTGRVKVLPPFLTDTSLHPDYGKVFPLPYELSFSPRVSYAGGTWGVAVLEEGSPLACAFQWATGITIYMKINYKNGKVAEKTVNNFYVEIYESDLQTKEEAEGLPDASPEEKGMSLLKNSRYAKADNGCRRPGCRYRLSPGGP